MPAWATTFLAWLEAAPLPLPWLQVRLNRTAGGFGLRHVDGADDDPSVGLDELAELVRTTASGRYRPLPYAPTLRAGWQLRDLSGASLVAALEIVYPAALALWAAERAGRLEPHAWSQVARRQTGQQGLLKRLAPADVQAAVEVYCGPGCLRRITWGLAPGQPLATPPLDSPVPCYEACSLLQSFLRRAIGWRRGEEPSLDPRLQEWIARVGPSDS
ncbi:MAG: hypothetical protein IT204_09710 [Fimbriimonadaceae bacterium]|nr:hypothetical protein [Fimbriimonadaceae bacterium]